MAGAKTGPVPRKHAVIHAEAIQQATRLDVFHRTRGPVDQHHRTTGAALHVVQRAEAHLALGQCEAAVKELLHAVELNANYPRSYYVLGLAYRDLGLKRKAQEAWKQHLEKSRRWKEEQSGLEGEEWKP